MARQRYPNPPIAEAVVDLRFRTLDTEALETARRVMESARADFPDQEPIREFEASFETGAEVGTGSSRIRDDVAGFIAKSADGHHVWQVQRSGFTVSRLAPYESWESLRDKARPLWDSLRAALPNLEVVRAAVRYINRIDVPEASSDLGRYFHVFPTVPPNVAPGVSGFLLRVQCPYVDKSAELRLSQAIVPPKAPNILSIVLDLDLWRTSELPNDSAGLWQIFDFLHELENTAFEACITDETRELFR